MKTFEDVKQAAKLYRELEASEKTLTVLLCPAKAADNFSVELNGVSVLWQEPEGKIVCRAIREALVAYWTGKRTFLHDELCKLGFQP